MPKKNLPLYTCLIFFFLFATSSSFCQSNLKVITKSFDKIVGEENLDINNGRFNLRDYRYVVPHHTKYLVNLDIQDQRSNNGAYTIGDVTYNGQHFYDVKLKYDLYKDLLVFNPTNAISTIACNLIRHKVDSFSIYNKKFVYLNPSKNTPNFEGYYQKIKHNRNFILYIKYDKNRRNIIKDDKVYYSYVPNYVFWLYYHQTHREISSINDVSDVFPALSEKIHNFHQSNKLLQKANPPLFYQKLMLYINNLLGS